MAPLDGGHYSDDADNGYSEHGSVYGDNDDPFLSVPKGATWSRASFPFCGAGSSSRRGGFRGSGRARGHNRRAFSPRGDRGRGAIPFVGVTPGVTLGVILGVTMTVTGIVREPMGPMVPPHCVGWINNLLLSHSLGR
ncbi:hypothetical protein BCR44DRAFT_1482942, partial [Catenaria anguillulae PL171]